MMEYKTVPKKYKCSHCGLERYTLPPDHCPDCGARKAFFEPINVEMETIEPLFNEPKHYHQYEIDTIDFLQKGFPPTVFKGFAIGSAIKYLHRYENKNGMEDLEKSLDYIKRLIEFHKEKNNG